jgi:methionyl-tRNA formyltransferase
VNVALMGSVSSSFFCLEALIRGGVEITAVLGLDESQADLISDYHSLRPLAQHADLPFVSFIKVSERTVEDFLLARTPDLLWVVGLSQLVPDRLIRIARRGGVGFHPTMLPQGRGRAPVAWTILRGERAAVTLFYLTDRPDAGDIIAQREVAVMPDDYSEDLIARTNDVLATVVHELAPLIRKGSLPRTPQDHSKATYYPRRTPADGLIDWTLSTDAIYRLVRAAGRPYPGAFTYARGRKLFVWRARPAAQDELGPGATDTACGTILLANTEWGILTRTADGGLWLTEATLEDGVDATVAGVLAVGLVLDSQLRQESDS